MQDGPRVSFFLPGLMLGQAEDWQRFLCWSGMVWGRQDSAPLTLFGKVGTSCTGMGASGRVLRVLWGWQLASRTCCDPPFAP